MILRAEIDNAMKTIALAVATYGNADGGEVAPSIPRLAAEFGWSEKHVQNQISGLRELGLLEVTRRRSPGRTVQHQLTVPGAGLDTLPMRTDINGYPRLGPELPKRGGRKPVLTGTPVPVKQDADQNSSSGYEEADRNSSSGVEPSGSPLTGTPVPVTERKPELEFQETGTGVPSNRNSSSGDHKDQTKTNPGLSPKVSLTSAEQDHGQAETNQPPGPPRDTTPEDPDAAYRAARRVLDAVRRYDPAALGRAMSQAALERDAQGVGGIHARHIRAAELLEDWHALGHTDSGNDR